MTTVREWGGSLPDLKLPPTSSLLCCHVCLNRDKLENDKNILFKIKENLEIKNILYFGLELRIKYSSLNVGFIWNKIKLMQQKSWEISLNNSNMIFLNFVQEIKASDVVEARCGQRHLGTYFLVSHKLDAFRHLFANFLVISGHIWHLNFTHCFGEKRFCFRF